MDFLWTYGILAVVMVAVWLLFIIRMYKKMNR